MNALLVAAFALGFTLGIPAARWADRRDRRDDLTLDPIPFTLPPSKGK